MSSLTLSLAQLFLWTSAMTLQPFLVTRSGAPFPSARAWTSPPLPVPSLPPTPFWSSRAYVPARPWISATCPTLLCDVSQGSPRPLVPSAWVPRVFSCFHGISHAGAKPTLREISRRFVWRGMRADVLRLARICPDCQQSKVHRHVHSSVVQRPVPQERFSSLHVDLIAPLPVSEGKSFLFTIIDRTTRCGWKPSRWQTSRPPPAPRR